METSATLPPPAVSARRLQHHWAIVEAAKIRKRQLRQKQRLRAAERTSLDDLRHPHIAIAERTMSQATWTDIQPALHEYVTRERILDPAERAQALKRIEMLARLLDDAFQLPGTRIRIGWDGLLGLIPGVGDTATTLLSGYIIWEAKRLGISKWTLTRMLGNLGIDFLVGAVPLLGDAFDLAWKANRRNIELLHRTLRNQTTSHIVEARVVSEDFSREPD
jgi:hypothetical protein